MFPTTQGYMPHSVRSPIQRRAYHDARVSGCTHLGLHTVPRQQPTQPSPPHQPRVKVCAVANSINQYEPFNTALAHSQYTGPDTEPLPNQTCQPWASPPTPFPAATRGQAGGGQHSSLALGLGGGGGEVVLGGCLAHQPAHGATHLRVRGCGKVCEEVCGGG